MPVSPPQGLLDRRLLIVTGKGGTGKTTVAAALAVGAVRSGRRVAVVEVGPEEHLPSLIEPEGPPVGYQGRELLPGLFALRIDPYDALAEYLSLQLPVPGLVRSVLRNRGFRQLLEASPGWRDLITLGKIWHLEQSLDERKRPRFDLLIVDAPATGHGLTFLEVPRVVVSAIRAGPLRRHSSWVEALIQDHRRTLLVPVSLAEELPARETAELVERVREDVGIAIDRVVVNGLLSDPCPAGTPDLDARLAALPKDLAIPGSPPPAVLAACVSHLRGRHEMQRHFVKEIGEQTGLPIHRLPLCVQGVAAPGALESLGERLLRWQDDE